MLLKGLNIITALAIWSSAPVAAEDSGWPDLVKCPRQYYAGAWHDEPATFYTATLKDTAASNWSCNQQNKKLHLGECKGHTVKEEDVYQLWVTYRADAGQGWAYHQAWLQIVRFASDSDT